MDNQSETKKVEKVKKPLTEKQLANLENMRKKALEKKNAKKQEIVNETNEKPKSEPVVEQQSVVEQPVVEQQPVVAVVKKSKSVKKKEVKPELVEQPIETETSGHNGPVDPDLIRKLHEKVDYVVEHINEKKKRKSNNEVKPKNFDYEFNEETQQEFIPMAQRYRFNFRGV